MTMQSMTSRRTFLSTASALAAGTVFGRRLVAAENTSRRFLPDDIAASPRGAAEFLPSLMPATDLRALATAAIDAARSAGASYADVRVAEHHDFSIWFFMDSPVVTLGSRYGYGLRVLVDDAWSFVHGIVPSPDAMAKAAGTAVSTARGYGPLVKRRATLAPAPVVIGEWRMPIEMDPFTVPFQDHSALLEAYANAARRNRYTHLSRSVKWTRETRIFASTEGSLTTQQTWRCDPQCHLAADYGMGRVMLYAPGLHSARSGGYETFAIPGLPDTIANAAEEAARMAALPRGPMDVGRYPVVMDGASTGVFFTRTVSPALELDRMLGTEADASGTSYLGSVDEAFGTPIVSPSLSVTAHRALPSVSAVKWDDEGVEAHSYPIIEKGRLIDFHSSRETAPELVHQYAQRNIPMRSHGCAVAPQVTDPILIRIPHTSIAPNPAKKSVDDLCQDMKKGVLVMDTIYLMCDPSLGSGLLYAGNATLLEVAGGKPIRRIEGNGLMFQSKKLWNTVMGLGDATTVREMGDMTFGGGIPKGMPWRPAPVSGSAPAAHFKEINVIAVNHW